MNKVVAIISDFASDYYHGVMKGVITKYHPDVTFVDLAQNQSHDVITAAWILFNSIDYFPNDAIFLIVVDPGVGTSRKPLLVKLDKRYIVVPDNGIISPLQDRIDQIIEINENPTSSNTFHGRDIFSPVVGQILSGKEMHEIGQEIHSVTQLPVDIQLQEKSGHVVFIDSFGNIVTNLEVREDSEAISCILQDDEYKLHQVNTFKDLQEGELGAIIGSCGTLEIVCNQQKATSKISNITVGTEIELIS